MSIQTTVSNTGQQAIIDTDVSKIFVRDNRYKDISFNNSGYGDVTLTAGTIMGRIAGTNLMVVLVSNASNGSQFPVGILKQTRVVSAGETVSLSVCIAGDVVESKLIFNGLDSITTVIESKTLGDRIGADTVGVILVGGDELTATDNR